MTAGLGMARAEQPKAGCQVASYSNYRVGRERQRKLRLYSSQCLYQRDKIQLNFLGSSFNPQKPSEIDKLDGVFYNLERPYE